MTYSELRPGRAMSSLPTTLSGLLRAAVEDAQAVGAMPWYRLDMGQWHLPDKSGRGCSVCMAGAVMVQRLGARPADNVDPESYDAAARDGLVAIDYMRRGLFLDAWQTLHSHAGPTEEQEALLNEASDAVSWATRTNGRASWDEYLDAAALLAEGGL